MLTDTRKKLPAKPKAPDPGQVLDRLARMIRRADEFVLGFVKCNHPLQQKEMRREFSARLGEASVLEVELDTPIVSLLDALAARLDPDHPPDVVCVYGLEKSINELQEASPVLGRLNNDRDLLRRAVPVPLLIWLPDFALDLVARGAPDFWAWRSGVYEFATERTLWQQEGDSAIILNTVEVFSLNLHEKNAEISHLRELLRTAENLPRQGKREKALNASLKNQMALIHQSLGQWDEAAVVYEQNLHTLANLGDMSGIAGTLHELAKLRYVQGDLQIAERLFRQSLGIKEDLGDKKGIAITLHNLAVIAQARGELAEAERLYRQSLGIKEDSDDKRGIAISLHQLGMLAQDRGDLAEAERLFRQSLGMSEDMGDRGSSAGTLHQLAILAQARGDLAEAERLYRQSLGINEDLGNKKDIALSYGQLGRLYQGQGQWRTALEHYLSAWSVFCELNSPYSQLARQDIQEVREQVGEDQFDAWLTEAYGKRAGKMKAKLTAAGYADEASGYTVAGGTR